MCVRCCPLATEMGECHESNLRSQADSHGVFRPALTRFSILLGKAALRNLLANVIFIIIFGPERLDDSIFFVRFGSFLSLHHLVVWQGQLRCLGEGQCYSTLLSGILDALLSEVVGLGNASLPLALVLWLNVDNILKDSQTATISSEFLYAVED